MFLYLEFTVTAKSDFLTHICCAFEWKSCITQCVIQFLLCEQSRAQNCLVENLPNKKLLARAQLKLDLLSGHMQWHHLWQRLALWYHVLHYYIIIM